MVTIVELIVAGALWTALAWRVMGLRLK